MTRDSWASDNFKYIPGWGDSTLVPPPLTLLLAAAAPRASQNMSLTAAKMRIPSATKTNKAIAFTRARSTAAAGSSASMLEAKSRVREHVRSISQTTTRNAVAAPSV